MVEDQSLTQMANCPTRKETILDLFMSINPPFANTVIPVPPLTTVKDHSIVFVDADTRAAVQPKTCHNAM